MLRDVSITAVTAGFVAVLVGYTSSAAIVFQAAEAAGATQLEVNSWLGALGIGTGITSVGLSLYYRSPVLTAWSTPGAALLVTSLGGFSMAEAIGAFLFSATLITLSGVTGWFARALDHLPRAIAAAMLAGVLLRFGMDVFVAMQAQLALVGLMFFGYLLCKRFTPRYAVVVVLALGVALAEAQGLIRHDQITLAVTVPVFTAPQFSWASIIGVGIPLFVVTMASQNVPGVAAMRASGYRTPVSPLITATGVSTLLLAPFGGYAMNLAAITAAICMGKEAHEDPRKRYVASVSAGIFYIILGIFGATIGALFVAFPRELVLAIAGIALFSTIAGSLSAALAEESRREPALIAFLITASGISLFGIGAAFWGLLGGVAAQLAFTFRKPASA